MLVALGAMLAAVGLALDLGFLFLVKNEAQTYTDMAALAAARALDGSVTGVDRARSAAVQLPMRWGLGGEVFPTPDIQFSADQRRWEAQPRSASDIRFVRVTANLEQVRLNFLPALIRNQTAQIRARSVAARQAPRRFDGLGPGLFPFALLAHDPARRDFGFRAGDEVTLRWPAGGAACEADRNGSWSGAARGVAGRSGKDEPGYVQDPTPEGIQAAIEDDLVTEAIDLGKPVRMSGGSRDLQAASLAKRVAQDTNPTASTYAEYRRRPGNGRRLVLVPVVDPQRELRVAGYATLFLPAKQPEKAFCAEFVGESGGGAATVRLVQ